METLTTTFTNNYYDQRILWPGLFWITRQRCDMHAHLITRRWGVCAIMTEFLVADYCRVHSTSFVPGLKWSPPPTPHPTPAPTHPPSRHCRCCCCCRLPRLGVQRLGGDVLSPAFVFTVRGDVGVLVGLLGVNVRV